MSRYTDWLKEPVKCQYCQIQAARHYMMYVHTKSEEHIRVVNHSHMSQYLTG